MGFNFLSLSEINALASLYSFSNLVKSFELTQMATLFSRMKLKLITNELTITDLLLEALLAEEVIVDRLHQIELLPHPIHRYQKQTEGGKFEILPLVPLVLQLLTNTFQEQNITMLQRFLIET